MALTWGSMNRREQTKALKAALDHTALDRECYEQARAEVNGDCKTGFTWIRAVLKRAQEIKAERMAAKNDVR